MAPDEASCRSCSRGLSRRQFLKATSGTVAAVALGGTGLHRILSAQETPAEDDKPVVRACFLRPKGKYWLGWPGTAYPVEERREAFTQALLDSGAKTGVRVVPSLEPIYDDEALTAFIGRVQESKPDAVFATLLHMNQWGAAQKIADSAGVPTIIFSPIGTSFTGHTLGISRQPGVHVISSLEMDELRYALKMVRTAFDLRRQRILRVVGDARSDSVLDTLGIAVRHIPRRLFHELFDETPETDQVRALADEVAEGAQKIVEPDRQDMLNAARTYYTIKELMARENATAVAIDCLGMVGGRLVPTPPCMAFSRLNDEGTTAACEADLMAAVGLMYVSHLFDRPGFMQDPVWESAGNRWIGAHCTCATRLDGFDQPPMPYILRSHAESDVGVAVRTLWRSGQRFTMVDFQSPNNLIVDRGTVVNNVQTPPAGGCRTSVRCEIDTVQDTRDVKGFHQVMFYGDHLQDVLDYCQLYGIEARTSA
jgi:hypothetical protein